MRTHVLSVVLVLSATVSSLAIAQTNPPEDTDPGEVTKDPNAAGESTPGTTATGVNGEALPQATSDNDPQPAPASPGTPEGRIVSQAGVGGAVAYGRAGVLELGGSAGFTAATDYTTVTVAPSIGWFLADNLQISAILNMQSAKVGDASTKTLFTGLIEPSYHMPFSKTVFGFLGVGAGLGYVEGPGTGFAIAPRLGANLLVGRSGIVTPALFFQYTTHEATTTPEGTVLAVSSAYGMQLGYTVMW